MPTSPTPAVSRPSLCWPRRGHAHVGAHRALPPAATLGRVWPLLPLLGLTAALTVGAVATLVWAVTTW